MVINILLRNTVLIDCWNQDSQYKAKVSLLEELTHLKEIVEWDPSGKIRYGDSPLYIYILKNVHD